MAELLADPEIEIVVNLTIPNAHADGRAGGARGGKIVYNEKPLTIPREDGRSAAGAGRGEKACWSAARRIRSWAAGLQTCRKLIDDG